MKGFGNNNKNKKKSKEKKDNNFQKDKLISNALSLHSKGKIKEASEIYNFLIQNKIYDPRIFNNLGSIYSQIKQFDKAIFLFNESIKKFPSCLEAYPNLANVLVAKGRNDNALEINLSFCKVLVFVSIDFLLVLLFSPNPFMLY